MNQLIEVSCPGKVILFGEWAVLRGAPGIGISIKPRFRLKAKIKKVPSGIDTQFLFQSCWIPEDLRVTVHSCLELFSPTLSQKIPKKWQFFFEAFCHVFKKDKSLFIKHFQNRRTEIKLNCDWLPAEGLGSSSALVACLLGLREALSKKKFAPTSSLFREGKTIIQKLQKGPASGLDLAVQLWGNSVVVQGNKVQPQPLLAIPKNMALIHTYEKFSTPKMIAQLISKKQKVPLFFKTIAQSTSRFLKSKMNYGSWVLAIDEHFIAFDGNEKLIPKSLNKTLRTWKNKNFVSTIKTTGAGGGDALLALTHAPNLSEFKKVLAQKGYTFRPHGHLGTKGLTIQSRRI